MPNPLLSSSSPTDCEAAMRVSMPPVSTPAALLHALAHRDPPPGLAAAVERLTRRYYGEGTMEDALRDPLAIEAYLQARLPATAAAAAAVMARLPTLAPRSLLDLGSGSGALLWAAAERWPDLPRVTALEREAAFAAAGQALLAEGPWPHVQWITGDLRRVEGLPAHDLVTASYALNELAPTDVDAALRGAWAKADKALLIIEPGMPRGAAVIRQARALLPTLGGYLAAPCPGSGPCPLDAAGDFCRFSVRLPRSRIHRQAKGTRGFEDEPYAWLLVTRHPMSGPARVIRPPEMRGDGIHLDLCTPHGRHAQRITRHDAAWKAAKRLEWGDAW